MPVHPIVGPGANVYYDDVIIRSTPALAACFRANPERGKGERGGGKGGHSFTGV